MIRMSVEWKKDSFPNEAENKREAFEKSYPKGKL